MLSNILKFYNITKQFDDAGFFETDNYKNTFKELKAEIKLGRLIALTGIMGAGKTVTTQYITQELNSDDDIIISESLAVEKGRVKISTLMTALLLDLNNQKNTKIQVRSELRERQLRDLIAKRKKPVALFIDEAHDLHHTTLVELKRLKEIAQKGGGILSIILVGHPKLKNDLESPIMEEIGARTSIIELEGIKGKEREYIEWVLTECSKQKTKVEDILTSTAIDKLAEQLFSPLQINEYLSRVIKKGFYIGQKPIELNTVESAIAVDLNAIEPQLVRQGYSNKQVADLLNTKPNEIKLFYRGKLGSERTLEIKSELLKITGIAF